jgi:BASS family bile acid:Na+ symporter
VPEAIAIGILIMACMPGGTTSNIFTYFSKGNLALSVLMTVTSTVTGVVLIPLILVLYATALDLDPAREHHRTLVLLLVPVAIGMVLRKANANVGAVTEFFGSALALFFIAFIAVSWVPRNWQFLLRHHAADLYRGHRLGGLRHHHRLSLRPR